MRTVTTVVLSVSDHWTAPEGYLGGGGWGVPPQMKICSLQWSSFQRVHSLSNHPSMNSSDVTTIKWNQHQKYFMISKREILLMTFGKVQQSEPRPHCTWCVRWGENVQCYQHITNPQFWAGFLYVFIPSSSILCSHILMFNTILYSHALCFQCYVQLTIVLRSHPWVWRLSLYK